MKYCTQCGFPNPDDRPKCFKCAEPLSLDVQAQTEHDVSAPGSSNSVADDPHLRACPFCQGDVAQNAKKCRHCGEWLIANQPRKKRILLYIPLMIVLLLCVAVAARHAQQYRSLPSQSKMSPQQPKSRPYQQLAPIVAPLETSPTVIETASSSDIEVHGTFTHDRASLDSGTVIDGSITNTGNALAPSVTIVADCEGFEFVYGNSYKSTWGGRCSATLETMRNVRPGETRPFKTVMQPILDNSKFEGHPGKGWGVCDGNPLNVTLHAVVMP
ncbi:MAG: hypothetical protein NT018_14555 [Armatimonadetes bacterium]|nr:hypothetical protein [Armatimonadota bacterium]